MGARGREREVERGREWEPEEEREVERGREVEREPEEEFTPASPHYCF